MVTRLLFDLEGGLSLSSDILQLAWIETDWDFNILSYGNEFFRNTSPIEQKETSIHRLSQEILWKKTEKYFQSEIPNLPLFFRDNPTQYITYTRFDIEKTKLQALKVGLVLDFGEEVTSLRKMPKPFNSFDAFLKSGSKLTDNLNDVDKIEVSKVLSELGEKNIGAHDALYDSVALLVVTKRWYYGS